MSAPIAMIDAGKHDGARFRSLREEDLVHKCARFVIKKVSLWVVGARVWQIRSR
jgi:hypothetical protein